MKKILLITIALFSVGITIGLASINLKFSCKEITTVDLEFFGGDQDAFDEYTADLESIYCSN